MCLFWTFLKKWLSSSKTEVWSRSSVATFDLELVSSLYGCMSNKSLPRNPTDDEILSCFSHTFEFLELGSLKCFYRWLKDVMFDHLTLLSVIHSSLLYLPSIWYQAAISYKPEASMHQVSPFKSEKNTLSFAQYSTVIESNFSTQRLTFTSSFSKEGQIQAWAGESVLCSHTTLVVLLNDCSVFEPVRQMNVCLCSMTNQKSPQSGDLCQAGPFPTRCYLHR